MDTIIKIILIGLGATFSMDIWAFILKKTLHIPSLNYAILGRWIGHFQYKTFYHQNITKSKPIKNEGIIGWGAHYTIGLSFAFLLVGIYGSDWLNSPDVFPALLIGITTIIAPFFIMQPAFGFGIAASKVPNPNIARLKSLLTHTIYGLGLYFSALLLNLV